MNLLKELKQINEKHGLTGKTKLKITCTNGDVLQGYYKSFVSALDNEPEIPGIDISGGDDYYYGLLETEIKKIEVI